MSAELLPLFRDLSHTRRAVMMSRTRSLRASKTHHVARVECAVINNHRYFCFYFVDILVFCIDMEFLFVYFIYNILLTEFCLKNSLFSTLVPHVLVVYTSMCFWFEEKDERGRGACVDPAPG